MELALCNEWGIPHSEFLSWSTEDRSKAVAFAIEKGLRCDLCGTAEWEWEENKRAYAPAEEFCMGCYIKTVFGQDGNDTPGSTIKLIPSNSVEHAKHLAAEKKKAARDASR
jgi:hypothetical protein